MAKIDAAIDRSPHSVVEAVQKKRQAKERIDTSVGIEVQHGDPSTLLGPTMQVSSPK